MPVASKNAGTGGTQKADAQFFPITFGFRF
jgi:hypothetical protein